MRVFSALCFRGWVSLIYPKYQILNQGGKIRRYIALVSRPEGVVEEEEGAEVVAGEPEIPRTLRLTTRQGRSA